MTAIWPPARWRCSAAGATFCATGLRAIRRLIPFRHGDPLLLRIAQVQRLRGSSTDPGRRHFGRGSRSSSSNASSSSSRGRIESSSTSSTSCRWTAGESDAESRPRVIASSWRARRSWLISWNADERRRVCSSTRRFRDHENPRMILTTVRHRLIALGLLVAASPAAAQWTRVLDLPETNFRRAVGEGATRSSRARRCSCT